MHPVFSAGDWVILDQSIPARAPIRNEDSFYLLKLRGEPLIRRVRALGEVWYIVAEDIAYNSSAWERIDTEADLLRTIRARASGSSLQRTDLVQAGMAR